MYALVDCNSFFCSVEKVFHPGLRGKPVCVLSNNDGCIVALTPEAKALGLKRGDPIFKVRDIVEQNEVHVFSSNMTLYAAMSKRVTNILRRHIASVEKYSIDECFCRLDGYESCHDLEEFMREIAIKIKTWTDIPVSVGIAPTKTLAKIGSRYAKKYKGYRSVCLINNEEKRRKALAGIQLADIWGIGRGTLKTLNFHGIQAPLAFADKKESWVRNHLNLPAVHTWMELNGIFCIETAEVMQSQSICTSRSFGEMVSDFDNLKESIAHFASSCANKLRGQCSVAREVTVYLRSNRFREDLKQYRNAATYSLPIYTADTLEITHAAINSLEQIYQPGILYKKAGVILSDIQPCFPLELQLFDPIPNRQERFQLMKAIDCMNQKYGMNTIRLGMEGYEKRPWHVKCEHRSPNYLTDINELLTIKI